VVIFGVFAPLGLAQGVVHNALFMPASIRDYPMELLAYFLVVAFVLYLYAGRFLVAPSVPADFTLSENSVRRFGISPREKEIISLVLQGYNHREIGERLFISAQTVKNHVYNIYQKTHVENRVQLLNLLHPISR
jgi:DNA-binding CsgD family transcriptional regulator